MGTKEVLQELQARMQAAYKESPFDNAGKVKAGEVVFDFQMTLPPFNQKDQDDQDIVFSEIIPYLIEEEKREGYFEELFEEAKYSGIFDADFEKTDEILAQDMLDELVQSMEDGIYSFFYNHAPEIKKHRLNSLAAELQSLHDAERTPEREEKIKLVQQKMQDIEENW